MVTKTHVANQEEGQEEKAVQMRSADPGSPFEGQLWINKTDQKMRYQNSGIKEIGAAVGGGTSLPDEGFANYISTANAQAVPNTEIENRAQVNYDLRPGFGAERIMFNSISLKEDEFGPNGEPVYEIANGDERIRAVGGSVSGYNGTSGNGIVLSANSDFIEITFYGTGLNILQRIHGGSITMERTVDGVSEGAFFSSSGYSTILEGRKYKANQISEVKSGLTLGLHTIKINRSGDTPVISGIEILNESTQFSCREGNAYNKGATDNLLADSLTDYNQGIAGAKGARVVKYLQGNEIKTAVQEVDASQLNLSSADHSNEEISRRINFREFGANRGDDFSTLSTTASDRAFTLDDGSTTLVGDSSRTITSTVGEDALFTTGIGTGSRLYFQFVGTGLDINITGQGVSFDTYDVIVNGSSIGTINGSASPRTLKIVSGLPYGTHVVIIQRTTTVASGMALKDYIIYQPKKPAIPADGMEVADYNVLADYVANSTFGLEYVATGVLRKAAIREWIFTGTWSIAFNCAAHIAGSAPETSTNGGTASYTFFGTGFEYRAQAASNRSNNITVSVDGVTDHSSYTTSVYGTGVTFNDSTGVLDMNNGSTILGCGLTISGLPLGLHTVVFTNNTSNIMASDAFDIITPIHSAQGLDASSFKGERNFSPFKREDIVEELIDAEAYLVFSGSTNEIFESKGVSAVIDVGTGTYHVYWEKAFVDEPKIIASCNENRTIYCNGILNDEDSQKYMTRIIGKATSTGSTADMSMVRLMAYGKVRK